MFVSTYPMPTPPLLHERYSDLEYTRTKRCFVELAFVAQAPGLTPSVLLK